MDKLSLSKTNLQTSKVLVYHKILESGNPWRENYRPLIIYHNLEKSLILFGWYY